MSVEEIIKEMGVMDIQIEDSVLSDTTRLNDYLRKEVVRRFPAVAIYYLEKVREHFSPGNRARLSRIALTSMVLSEYLGNQNKKLEQGQNFFPLDKIIRTLESIYLKTNGLSKVADQILKDEIVVEILGKARKRKEYWLRDNIIEYLGVGHNKKGLLPQLIKANVRYVFSKLYLITKNGKLRYELEPVMDQSPKNAGKNMFTLSPVRDISLGRIPPYEYAVTSRSPLHLAQDNP